MYKRQVKYHNEKASPAPYFNLDDEFELHQCIKQLISKNIINAAHDCADGGLFVTIVEMAMASDLGCNLKSNQNFRKDAFLFGESQGRVVVTVSPNLLNAFNTQMNEKNIPCFHLGKVTQNPEIIIDSSVFGTAESFKEISNSVISL